MTVTDTFGCTASDSSLVGSPLPISAILQVGNESSPGAYDGQIDLTVSGGIPCITAAMLATHNSALSSKSSLYSCLILTILSTCFFISWQSSRLSCESG